MEFLGIFSFLIILKESFTLLPKNGKIIALISILYLLFSTAIQALLTYSVVSLTNDLLSSQKPLIPNQGTTFNASDPTSFTPDLSQMTDQLDHMKRILAAIFSVEIALVLVNLIISFFAAMAIILVSAMSYKDKTLSLKDLFSRIKKTWTKSLLTAFYVWIHALGFSLAFGLLASPAAMYQNFVTISFAILVGIVWLILVLYFSIIWEFAIVISVLEEGFYGMKAMGKASEIVNGQKLKGYMLNIFFALFGLIIFTVYRIIVGNNPSVFSPLFLGLFSQLVTIFQLVAYTVLYFHCKKHCGEEIEIFRGGFQYDILPTTQG